MRRQVHQHCSEPDHPILPASDDLPVPAGAVCPQDLGFGALAYLAYLDPDKPRLCKDFYRTIILMRSPKKVDALGLR